MTDRASYKGAMAHLERMYVSRDKSFVIVKTYFINNIEGETYYSKSGTKYGSMDYPARARLVVIETFKAESPPKGSEVSRCGQPAGAALQS